MKNPDTETFTKVVIKQISIIEETPNTNTVFFLKASSASRFEISNTVSIEEVAWVGAIVNNVSGFFVYTLQNSRFLDVRQGMVIVNGLGETENFGSLKGVSPAAFDRKTSLSFVSDDAVTTDYIVRDTKLITLPTEAGIYFRPTTNVSTRYIVKDTDVLGPGDGLKTDITPITINSVQDDGNGKAQFNVTATEEPVLGEVVQNSGFTTNTAYNKARPVIAQGSGFYVLDIPFGTDEGGSFQTGSAQSDNVNVTSEGNIGIATSMIIGGFNLDTLISTTANLGFADFDFTANPVIALTTQERFILIDEDTGEIEYTGLETLVLKVTGTLNADGSSGAAVNGTFEWKVQADVGSGFADIPDSHPSVFGITSSTDASASTFDAVIELKTGDRLKPQHNRSSGTRPSFGLLPFVVNVTRG